MKKLLEMVDRYRFYHGEMKHGQVMWPTVLVEDPPAYRKPISWMSQTPMIVTIVNQEDINDLRNDADRQQLRNRAIVRAAHDAYARGVLTCTDLGLLFQLGHNRIAQIIREYEAETDEVVPRRGTTMVLHRNIHDMDRTVSTPI